MDCGWNVRWQPAMVQRAFWFGSRDFEPADVTMRMDDKELITDGQQLQSDNQILLTDRLGYDELYDRNTQL